MRSSPRPRDTALTNRGMTPQPSQARRTDTPGRGSSRPAVVPVVAIGRWRVTQPARSMSARTVFRLRAVPGTPNAFAIGAAFICGRPAPSA